jgi:hypothetical protein
MEGPTFLNTRSARVSALAQDIPETRRQPMTALNFIGGNLEKSRTDGDAGFAISPTAR